MNPKKSLTKKSLTKKKNFNKNMTGGKKKSSKKKGSKKKGSKKKGSKKKGSKKRSGKKKSSKKRNTTKLVNNRPRTRVIKQPVFYNTYDPVYDYLSSSRLGNSYYTLGQNNLIPSTRTVATPPPVISTPSINNQIEADRIMAQQMVREQQILEQSNKQPFLDKGGLGLANFDQAGLQNNVEDQLAHQLVGQQMVGQQMVGQQMDGQQMVGPQMDGQQFLSKGDLVQDNLQVNLNGVGMLNNMHNQYDSYDDYGLNINY
jgi:hypothetical protein